MRLVYFALGWTLASCFRGHGDRGRPRLAGAFCLATAVAANLALAAGPPAHASPTTLHAVGIYASIAAIYLLGRGLPPPAPVRWLNDATSPRLPVPLFFIAALRVIG